MATAAAGPLWHTFNRTFRAEHREVRDALLALADALERRDVEEARRILGEIAALTGPHFRYEEEALYPSLVPIFGPEYVAKLYTDHDRAIGAAARLVELAAGEELSEEEAAEGVALVRGILPHVSDCDGLSIMVEVLGPAAVRRILDAREAALADGLGLLAWAAGPRGRPLVPPGEAPA